VIKVKRKKPFFISELGVSFLSLSKKKDLYICTCKNKDSFKHLSHIKFMKCIMIKAMRKMHFLPHYPQLLCGPPFIKSFDMPMSRRISSFTPNPVSSGVILGMVDKKNRLFLCFRWSNEVN